MFIISSCSSLEENKDTAADEARQFIFDNVRHISLENYNYIKYTYPKILINDILITQGRAYNQYYFAWDLPNPKITVLVYGTSFNDFREWEPIRMVFKEYKPDQYKKAVESTKTWAIRPTWQDAYYKLDSRQVRQPGDYSQSGYSESSVRQSTQNN